jgi:phenylacetate-CoA ligase
MSKLLLSVYHALPAPVQPVIASLRGAYLRRWRYGPKTDQLVREALERDFWSPRQWHDWQRRELGQLLQHACVQVRFYREQWGGRQRDGTAGSPSNLADWPILERQEVQAGSKRFLADGCGSRKMFCDRTGGTTSPSLKIWQSRQTVRRWYALFEARCRHWYGVSRHDNWGMLGGQLVAPVARRRPPFWVWNSSLNQLYLSSYHLAPDLIPDYLRALRSYKVRYLIGFTSALYTIAREILETKLDVPQLKVIITNAEPLFDHQREAIAAAFHCPVRETYGMAEIVAGASECEAGRLHLWPDAGIVEVLDGDQPVANGEVGDLICTGLINADMPLVRYRVGDRGSWPPTADSCPCGRTLPVLGPIEGRTDDVLYTSDGRTVGILAPVFKSDLRIREAQIVQERRDLIRVRIVPAPGFTDADGRTIISNVKARMGAVTVVLEPLSAIPRSANGKFRSVICELSGEEKHSPHKNPRPVLSRR